MVRWSTIFLTIVLPLIIAAVIVTTVLLVMRHTSPKPPPPPVQDFPYGPTMYYQQTVPPLNGQAGGDWNGLIYANPYVNAKGTTGIDVTAPYIDPSVLGKYPFSSSGWVSKAFWNIVLWDATGPGPIKGSISLGTGLFFLQSNTGHANSDPYNDNLYMYSYYVPYVGMLSTNSFSGSVDSCAFPSHDNNKYLGVAKYRQMDVNTVKMPQFFCPTMCTPNFTHIGTGAITVLTPPQMTFATTYEQGSEFTSQLIYKNASEPTQYFKVTMSKLIPYIVVEFTGAFILNASAGAIGSGPLTGNLGYTAVPTGKVFSFDSGAYTQPSGEINQLNVNNFIFSDGDRLLTFVSSSSPINVMTKPIPGQTPGDLTQGALIVVQNSSDLTSPTTLIIAPLSIAFQNDGGTPQIPLQNIDVNNVFMPASIMPSPLEAVTSIRCSRVILNDTNFVMEYTATTDSTDGFIFVPYTGMRLGTIEGASPISGTIYSNNTGYSEVYKSTGKVFTVTYSSYLPVPDFNYPLLNQNVSSLEAAIQKDLIPDTILLPIILNSNPLLCQDIYGFGKNIFNIAQSAWIANKISSPEYQQYFNILRDKLIELRDLRILDTDPSTFPDPGATSNYLCTFGYHPSFYILSPKDPIFGSSFNDVWGSDLIIHCGYVLISIYIYLVLADNSDEDAAFNTFVLTLMRNVGQPYLEDTYFPRMRHFDFANCMSWLSGMLDADNTESCSEVIMGYYGCYLMAKRFNDDKLQKFYKAILTLEIGTNQEIRFFGRSSSSYLSQLLERNGALWDFWDAQHGSPPEVSTVGVNPKYFKNLGMVVRLSNQLMSFSNLFGANLPGIDVTFIMFIPFSPITAIWWNKEIGQWVAQKVNASLQATLNYYNSLSTSLPDVTSGTTNALVLSSFNTAGTAYLRASAGLDFPAPMIGQYFPYAMQFMSYFYGSCKSAMFNMFVLYKYPSSASCGVYAPSPAVNINDALIDSAFYPYLSLDGGASNTVVRASLIAIQNLVS